MFYLSNLRKEEKEGWVYLITDFSVKDGNNPFRENTMWISVEKKNEDFLCDKTYDPFVLVPLILGMYYKQDVHIEGKISPRLYHNVNHYIPYIFDGFSDHTKKVDFSVDGVETLEETGKLVGTGISCGVDSLVTIYDNYILEENPDFKINSLFFFNCGTHGDYENAESFKRWQDRIALNQQCAEALGLPMYLVNSNFHAFTHLIGEQTIGYLAIYSCVLGVQKKLRRYLTSSNLCYDEIMDNRNNSRDFDFAEYCESWFPHLVSTEHFELVIDGCQYTRAEKTERISDWEIAQKYLNVCINPVNNGHNCSKCEKCMWTLLPLDAMGKLDMFNEVFDMGTYRANKEWYKNKFVSRIGRDSMETSVINYVSKQGMRIPSIPAAKVLYFKDRALRKLGMSDKPK